MVIFLLGASPPTSGSPPYGLAYPARCCAPTSCVGGPPVGLRGAFPPVGIYRSAALHAASSRDQLSESEFAELENFQNYSAAHAGNSEILKMLILTKNATKLPHPITRSAKHEGRARDEPRQRDSSGMADLREAIRADSPAPASARGGP
jgi:hypothetical protein